MTPQARQALQRETAFLSGVGTKLESVKGKLLRGTIWRRSEHDEIDRLIALMAEAGVHDREKRKELPGNRRVSLHGFERRWWFGKRRTGVATASVLSPLAHYVEGSSAAAPPISLGMLAAHVRKIVGTADVPHVVGVCSPSGFADEVHAGKLQIANTTVVLIEPDASGGWKVSSAGGDIDRQVLELFDPEDMTEKIDRVKHLVEQESADLLTGGLTVSNVAKRLSVPPSVAKTAFEQVARQDPELRVADTDGEFLLYRGAPSQGKEKTSMNFVDRIKQLLSKEGDENEKINLLSQRRAALAQRRDRIYEDIAKFEKKEAELLEQGRAASSNVPKRRIAAQLAQVRKDIGRQNTTASMLNQQINIISTDIHNLTLIKQGEMAKLPDTQELTENAVKAEEMLESLKADADLVAGLETGLEGTMESEEELAILAEFDEPAQADKVADTGSTAGEPIRDADAGPLSEAPLDSESDRKRDAEPT